MRHHYSFVLLVLFIAWALCLPLVAQVTREIFVSEDFSSTTFPPTGWSVSAQAGNWSRFVGNNAGGVSPEARLNWSPRFNGATYLISPMINTMGLTTVKLDFNHLLDHYASPYQIGVATRSSSGAWTNVWTANPNANVGPELKSITISNADVGSDSFQFGLFFNGDSYNIDYWYIDNVKLYTPFPYDLGIDSAAGASQMEPNTIFSPSCVVENTGENTLTAVVSLEVKIGDEVISTVSDYAQQTVLSGANFTATFPQVTLDVTDEIYSFVFSVTSLEDVVDGDLTNNTFTKHIETYTTAKQNVLLEIATGGWCQYCPGAAMGADDLHAGGYNVAIVENHNGDPYATTISNGRNTYYGVSGYPTSIFDGVVRYVGGSASQSLFSAFLPVVQQREVIKTPVAIEIFGTQDRQNYNLQVKINKTGRIIRPNLVLHVAITESEIAYTWHGQTHFSFVNRNMIPGLDGTPVDLMNLDMPFIEVELPLIMGETWVHEHCELVAWVQDLDTKEVLQAAKVLLSDLQEPVSNYVDGVSPVQTALNGNYPNPFNPETNISFGIKEAVHVSLEIYNLKGQLVKNLVNDVKPAGNHVIVWNGKDNNGNSVSSGLYYYKMTAGKYSSTKKMIMMK